MAQNRATSRAASYTIVSAHDTGRLSAAMTNLTLRQGPNPVSRIIYTASSELYIQHHLNSDTSCRTYYANCHILPHLIILTHLASPKQYVTAFTAQTYLVGCHSNIDGDGGTVRITGEGVVVCTHKLDMLRTIQRLPCIWVNTYKQTQVGSLQVGRLCLVPVNWMC
jgi:hypothetical protein